MVMINVSTKQLATILQAQLMGNEQTVIETVNTDTRQYCPSSLFFALKGERFDGHQYLAQAVQQGAVALVVQQYNPDITVPQLVVADSKKALGRLAQWLKAQINPKTIAITGSSGKTTVKEMTASILACTAQDKRAVLFTQGNFNNDIGVPLTLLRLTEKHQFAVVELGANHLGEIAYTTDLVRPDVALVNNVAAAHLEGFGSLTGVAQAKGEIYQGLSLQGTAIINMDCQPYLPLWQANLQGREVRYFSSENPKADYHCKQLQLTPQGSSFILCSPQGEIAINLAYLGQHNVSNALAAAALAMSVGASLEQVKQGLEQGSQVKGRLYPIEPCENLLLLDDTYNANVDSLISAIKVLQSYPAYRILLVGDMAELGENTADCHQQVADFAACAKLDKVYSLGQQSQVISQACQGQHFEDKSQLMAQLLPIIQQQLERHQPVVVLAKGSRRMKMEALIQLIEGAFLC